MQQKLQLLCWAQRWLLQPAAADRALEMVGETPVPEVMQVLEAVLRQRKVIRMTKMVKKGRFS